MKKFLRIIPGSIAVICIIILAFLGKRSLVEDSNDSGFENIENYNSLSVEQQERILNLIGEWEIEEWSIQLRGYGYNEDWHEENDFYIGKKITIHTDGTAIYDNESYQVSQDEISVYGYDVAFGSGYAAGDAERLGEQLVITFFPSETHKPIFWIHIGEDGQVYYEDLTTGGLYSMRNLLGSDGISTTELQDAQEKRVQELADNNESNNKLPVEIQDNSYRSDCITVIEKTYEEMENGFDIEIIYPELYGMEDLEKEERINQMIKAEALRLIPEENEFPDEWIENGYVTCAFLNYEIKFLNDNIISILYKGMNGCMVKGLDGVAMATTIDLQEEKVIKLNDVVTDMKLLHSLLLSDSFQGITLWEGVVGEDLISEEYGDEREIQLMEALNESSNEYPFIEWYTDGKNLIIVSTSPYGMEDYNEYAASLKSLEEIVSQEFVGKMNIES